MTGTSPIPAELLAEMTPAVRVFVEQLLARIATLEATVAELRNENELLRAQVKKLTPRNSSLPPSSEHPHAKPPRGKASGKGKRKKKHGGQPGHQRQERALIPTEDCAAVIPCFPDGCRRCGEAFGQDIPDLEPLRHQVWEIEIQSVITEYVTVHGPGGVQAAAQGDSRVAGSDEHPPNRQYEAVEFGPCRLRLDSRRRKRP